MHKSEQQKLSVSYQTEGVSYFLEMSDDIPRIPFQISQLVNNAPGIRNCAKFSYGAMK